VNAGQWIIYVAAIYDGYEVASDPVAITVLGQPSNFQGSFQMGPRRMHFSWSAPEGPQPDHYKVFTQDGPSFPFVVVPGDVLEADILNPAVGYYLMRCAAVDADGNEYPCPIISVSVPEEGLPPSGVSVEIDPQE